PTICNRRPGSAIKRLSFSWASWWNLTKQKRCLRTRRINERRIISPAGLVSGFYQSLFNFHFMSQLEIELKQLKSELVNMWSLVHSQLVKSNIAMVNFDKDLAREVISREKRVNGSELKIDRDCENIFALLTPVAVDLRFVLAVLKINSNLERIGDIAEGV